VVSSSSGMVRGRRFAVPGLVVVVALGLLLASCMVNQTALDPADRLDPGNTFNAAPSIGRVRYGPDPQNHLDVFEPVGDALGIVMWFHSGGWGSGDQTNVDALVGSLLDRGYIIVLWITDSFPMCGPRRSLPTLTERFGSYAHIAMNGTPRPDP